MFWFCPVLAPALSQDVCRCLGKPSEPAVTSACVLCELNTPRGAAAAREPKSALPAGASPAPGPGAASLLGSSQKRGEEGVGSEGRAVERLCGCCV